MEISSGLGLGTAEEEATCDIHGDYTAHFIITRSGKKGGGCPACIQEQNRRDAQERAARIERMAEDERLRKAAESGITPRMVGKSFDDFQTDTPEQIRALKLSRELVERVMKNPVRSPSLILAGKPGNGKTHLACAMVFELVKHRTVLRRNMADIIGDIRATWGSRGDETDDCIERFASLDLLIIDEVGAGYGTDSERSELFRIIDRRYERMLPVVLITNLDAQELSKEIGERVMDRLREDGGKLVQFTGQSMRKASTKSQ